MTVFVVGRSNFVPYIAYPLFGSSDQTTKGRSLMEEEFAESSEATGRKNGDFNPEIHLDNKGGAVRSSPVILVSMFSIAQLSQLLALSVRANMFGEKSWRIRTKRRTAWTGMSVL